MARPPSTRELRSINFELPDHVVEWVRDVFQGCNLRVSEKLSNNPNAPEQTFDLTIIEHLSQFASPIAFGSGWTVRIDTHYLGGLRHFRRWEIADIGVLLFFRQGRRVVGRKVALLQAKRLYPTTGDVLVEGPEDYVIGMARIGDLEKVVSPLTTRSQFSFNQGSKYGALVVGDDQFEAIKAFKERIPVHYMLYNPWKLPFKKVVPMSRYGTPRGECSLGCRVLPSGFVFDVLSDRPDGHAPEIREFKGFGNGDPNHRFGWRLEYFIADLLLRCREGHLYESGDEVEVQNLFYRRTGPIAAAIAVHIEQPG